MTGRARNLRRGALATGVALLLAVVPGSASAERGCEGPTCDQLCDRACKAIGAFGGYCPPGGGCVCWL